MTLGDLAQMRSFEQVRIEDCVRRLQYTLHDIIVQTRDKMEYPSSQELKPIAVRR